MSRDANRPDEKLAMLPRAEQLETRRFLRALSRNRGAVFGFWIIAALLLVIVLGDVIAPYDPLRMRAGELLSPPNAAHWFGTDEFGRDLFSRMVLGTRLTFFIGFFAVSISCTVGVATGLTAAYIGGRGEAVIMRAVDVLLSFTSTLIALACVAVLGPTLRNAVIAVGISAIPYYARVAHSAVLVEKDSDYFLASKAIGATHGRLIFLHLLPNILSPVIVITTLGIATAVLSAAGLSFLGLGAQPPSPEWGALLSIGRNYLLRAPWMTTIPGTAIAFTVLAFNLLGDGIREAVDPAQRRRR
jgi:peptide/nickel transport system permease protein